MGRERDGARGGEGGGGGWRRTERQGDSQHLPVSYRFTRGQSRLKLDLKNEIETESGGRREGG